MSIKIRAYCNEDVAAMNKIWNGIVTQGNAFPQTELLDETNGKAFSALKHTAVLPKIQKAMKLRDCTFCTQTMWADVRT